LETKKPGLHASVHRENIPIASVEFTLLKTPFPSVGTSHHFPVVVVVEVVDVEVVLVEVVVVVGGKV
jgi:hypothetical protein